MRKLALCCGGFAAGVFLWRYLMADTGWLPLAAAGLCALTGLVCGLAGVRRVKLAALGLCVGLLWSVGWQAVFFAPAQRLDGVTTPVTLTVTQFPQRTTAGAKVLCRLESADGPDIQTLFYAGEELLDLVPGDLVSTTAQLAVADSSYGEEVTWYTSDGTFLLAYSRGSLAVTPAESIPLWALPAYWNRALVDTVSAVCPPSAAALVTAIVTGEREGLDDSLNAALARTGLSHTVAVSGMHISFLIGAMSMLLGPHRRRTALVCLPVVLFFCLAVGSTPSVVRATVMQAAFFFAPLVGRENDSPTTLSLALAFLLLFNPYAAASISLQLSFAAVAGILYLAPRVKEGLDRKLLRKGKGFRLKLWNGFWSAVSSTLAASLGAILFTTPLSAYYFGAVSLIAPVANLLCLWVVSFLFVFGLSAAAVGFIFLPAGQIIGLAVLPGSSYFLWLVPLLGRLPFAAVTMGSVYYRAWLAAAYAIIAAAVLCRGQRRLVFAGAAALVTLCAAFLLTAASYQWGDLAVAVLDVGQGQSVLLTSDRRTALVDCGGSSLDDPGDIAADYLLEQGSASLDYLILTHYHDDHANGVLQLLERMEVAAILMPDTDPDSVLRLEIEEKAEALSIPITYVTEDTLCPLGDAVITLYAPLGDGGANEEGLSLVASAGDFDALITGDMNSYVEARLVKYGGLPDCELLVVGHHGSKHSSSQLLLEAVTPEIAVISVGFNYYGHPTDEAMSRLAAVGADLYRTDLMGTVTVSAH